jgi:hypothetical protein
MKEQEASILMTPLSSAPLIDASEVPFSEGEPVKNTSSSSTAEDRSSSAAVVAGIIILALSAAAAVIKQQEQPEISAADSPISALSADPVQGQPTAAAPPSPTVSNGNDANTPQAPPKS